MVLPMGTVLDNHRARNKVLSEGVEITLVYFISTHYLLEH